MIVRLQSRRCCHADTANDLSSSSSKFENQRDKEEEEDKYGWMNSAIWFPFPYMQVSQVYKCNFETASLRMAISFYGAAARARRRHRILAEAEGTGRANANGRARKRLSCSAHLWALNPRHIFLERLENIPLSGDVVVVVFSISPTNIYSFSSSFRRFAAARRAAHRERGLFNLRGD